MSNQYTEFHSHTPTLDTSAYADGDLMANPEELNRLFPQGTSWVTVTDLVVIGKSDNAQPFDIYFTKSSASWGTLNDAVSITDAVAADIVGRISVAAADFDDFTNNQIAFKHDLRVSIPHADDSKSIYVAMVSRGTGTYAEDGMVLKFGVEKG